MKNYLAERVYPRLKADGECWVWTGAVSPKGYGRCGRGPVHVVVWEDRFGPLPDGLVLDHLCFRRSCANPDHLDPVPAVVNSTLARRKPREVCRQGHSLAEFGYFRPSGKRNGRYVQSCRRCRARS